MALRDAIDHQRALGIGDRRIAADPGGWWRDAVVYQVYIRSFCDGDGDGIGDLAGLRTGLAYLRDLGVDGIWLNPCYPSPQRDHGYDITDYLAIEPTYGDLEEFDAMLHEAHRLGMRVILDLVPNHCSAEHPWFRQALAGGPASSQRRLFHFAPGRGRRGALPPNNWRSMFGGSAWERVIEPDGRPGEWYLHLYAPEQPDWNWRSRRVRLYFEEVLNFWLDRGIDGFRIDAAAGLFKHRLLPDCDDPGAEERTGEPHNRYAWGQPELHPLYRSWRSICDAAGVRDGRERVLIGEVGGFVADEQLRDFLRPRELHEAFLFDLLDAPWDAQAFRHVLARELAQADTATGSIAWVLGNHDRVRMATRYGSGAPGAGAGERPIGLDRARGAAMLLLALPGPVYLYQGDELGLPEVTDLPDELIVDPIFRYTKGQRRGRDGCRVPLPWRGLDQPFGFSLEREDVSPWLPQPSSFAEYTIERQRMEATSTWHLYRSALALRRNLNQLRDGQLAWLDSPEHVLAFARGEGFICVVNFGPDSVAAPSSAAAPLLSSAPMRDGEIPPNTAAWWL
jgi:alpha-glucosidase